MFHFVQAAEKSIKALLYFKGISAWGHSLVDLFTSCEKVQIYINEDLKSIAQKMEIHYSSSRYPDALPDISPKEAYDLNIAEEIKIKTQKIIDFVKETKKRLNEDFNKKSVKKKGAVNNNDK